MMKKIGTTAPYRFASPDGSPGRTKSQGQAQICRLGLRVKPWSSIVFLVIAALLCLHDSSGAEQFVWREVENKAFKVGEYNRYVLRWGLIHGGYSTMEISSVEQVNGRQSYHIISKTRSNSFFDTFYKVRDLNQSWMDVASLCSHRFSKNIREGGYRKKKRMEYDHVNRKVAIFKKNQVVDGEITPFIQDVLSALYYVRVEKLEIGNEISIDVNTSGKNWPLVVKVYKKEKVTVPSGTYQCILVEPRLVDEGIFETKGKIWVWMTDDERHLPVMMRTKIKIGSITAELISTEKKDSDNDF